MIKTFAIVHSASGHSYRLFVNPSDEEVSCECPHWQFRLRKSKTRCKHLKAALKLFGGSDWYLETSLKGAIAEITLDENGELEDVPSSNNEENNHQERYKGLEDSQYSQ